jgi:diadenosine tetraphosphate (Ap4A) HIT family hydrolase
MKKINRLSSYKDAPWPDENIVQENENIVVYRDGYPVTEGHLLFVPKKVERQLDITRCFELAYKWGVKGVCNYEYEAFNVGINNGEAAGQSVMWPHVHLIPRRKGDTPYPKGGVRHVIPLKGNYDDTTEDGWENEGGMALPVVDDNTPREELDNWKNGVSKRRKILFHHWYDKDGRMV